VYAANYSPDGRTLQAQDAKKSWWRFW